MDWKQFIAEMAGALAWPAVAAIALIAYRKNVGGVIDRIEHAKFWGQEATLTQTLQNSREDAVALNAAKVTEDEAEPVSAHNLPRPISFSPEGAVLSAFLQVENALTWFRDKFEMPPRTNLSVIMRELQRRDLVDEHTERLFRSLYKVRNSVSHDQLKVSQSEALEFMQQASVLAESIRVIQLKVQNDSTAPKNSPTS